MRFLRKNFYAYQAERLLIFFCKKSRNEPHWGTFLNVQTNASRALNPVSAHPGSTRKRAAKHPVTRGIFPGDAAFLPLSLGRTF